ncbi:uncharacterized protein LOC106463612 isoform X2 [Limulus polyphemus]|nr:uncharacterized protein LOC106463612 isoform X2 [Limulus polyphemus]
MKIKTGQPDDVISEFSESDVGELDSSKDDVLSVKKENESEDDFHQLGSELESTLDVKLYENNFCGNHLKEHEMMPGGSTSHICVVSGEEFVSESNLKSHAKILTEEKPYSCARKPRTYQRISKRNSWDSVSMERALETLTKGEMGFKKAAKVFGIPRSTLKRRYKDQNKQAKGSSKALGRFQTTFSPAMEHDLVHYIHMMEEMMFGIGGDEVRRLAYQQAERTGLSHRFRNEKAGKEWLRGFLSRNPELSVRTPDAISAARARGFDRQVVSKFFNILEQLFDEHKFSPNNIYSVDETGLSIAQSKPSKIIELKNHRQVRALKSAEYGQLVTVEICMSATGSFVPPLFVFPWTSMDPELMNGAPRGSLYACHKSGRIQLPIFTQWFNHFLRVSEASKENKVLLILDGHSTYTINLDVVNLAKDNGVFLLCLPTHCSHRLQPLNVSFMKPLTSYYTLEVESWLRHHPGRNVTVFQVAELFNRAYLKAAIAFNAVNGFFKTGIYPVARNLFEDHEFAPANLTERPFPEPREVQVSQPVTFPTSQPPSGQNTFGWKKFSLVKTGRENICDNAIASTSYAYVSPVVITPSSKVLPVIKHRRKRKLKSSSAQLLTSYSYKKMLIETDAEVSQSSSEKERKKELTKERKKSREQQKEKRGKRMVKRSSKTNETSSETLNDDNDTACLFCGETYSKTPYDGWIQCSHCKEWSHEECAGVDSDDEDFICDICQNWPLLTKKKQAWKAVIEKENFMYSPSAPILQNSMDGDGS